MGWGTWGQAMWLSNRDLCQAMERAVLADGVGFAVLNLMSDNPGMRWDIETTKRAIGYAPRDGAAPVATDVIAADERTACELRGMAMQLDDVTAATAMVAMQAFADDEATLVHVLARRVAENGDKAWLLTDDTKYSYRDIDRLACRFANGLAKLGVARGDTVLLMLNNCVEFIALWCALGKLGAIEVPVNCHYRGRLLGHLIGDSARAGDDHRCGIPAAARCGDVGICRDRDVRCARCMPGADRPSVQRAWCRSRCRTTMTLSSRQSR